MKKILFVLFVLGIGTSGALAATLNVPANHTTIAAAILAANPYDTITIDNGIYSPTGTLTVNKALTITGASEAGVVINIPAAGGYGMIVTASDITLENFTLVTNAANENFPIHASGTSNLPNGFNNLTLQNITIQGSHRRTGFDVHGYNTVIMSHLTSSDAYGGNGAQITGCVGVTVDNITTLNNAWGSFAIYSSKLAYLNRGSDNVIIDGTSCSFGEVNLYNQDEFGLFNTNITVTGYDYIVKNDVDAAGYDWFQVNLTAASAFALAVGPNAYMIPILGGPFEVVAGMLIQSAIDAAAPGDVVNIGAGTYTEAVIINKHVDLIGAGSGTNPAVDTIITCNSGVGPRIFTMEASGVSAADPILFQDMRLEPDSVVGFEIHNLQVIAFVELDNVKVDGTNQTNDTESEIGIRVATDGVLTDLVVTDCTFDHLTYGWYFAKSVGTSTVSGVTATNTSFSNNDAKGIYVEKLENATFTGCTVHNNGIHTSFWNSDWNGGFDINLKYGDYANLTFSDCSFTDNGQFAKEGAGLLLKGRGTGTLDTSYAANPATLDNVLVEDCTFTGNERGVRFGEPGKDNTTPTNAVVTDCTIMNNVQTYVGVDGSSYGGVVNQTTATTDAALNWWGDNDPSDQISGLGTINVSPWLGAAPGTTPMTWYVDPTGTIQEAIDAANPGDTINVAAGTYDENLNFNKSITLNGPNAAISPNTDIRVAEAVLMPSVDTAITGTANGITVVIRGLVVDMALGVNDDDRAMTQTGKTGTSWEFEHNIFQNAPECINGQWYISGNTGMQFTLLDNLFTGNDVSNGISIWNAMPTTANIQDNVWENNEYTAMNLNNIHGVISNNIFRDTRTIDFGDLNYAWYYFQSGLLLAGDNFDLDITNNLFQNVQYGVSMYANVDGPIDITNNVFDGVAISGVRGSGGQYVAGSDLDEVTVSNNELLNYFGSGFMVSNARPDGSILTAENNWWGTADGAAIALLAEDFVDFDPWLGQGAVTAVADLTGPLTCGQTVTVTFSLTTDAFTPDAFGYNAIVSFPEAVTAVKEDVFDELPFTAVNANFFVFDQGVGTLNISASTVGSPSSPITGVGTYPLFSIEFTTADDGLGEITFDEFTLRDPNNVPIDAGASGTTITVDCTAPAAVTAITAGPRHNKVDVSWTHDLDDVDHFKVYRGLWYDTTVGNSAYPEYDDVGAIVPTRPSAYEVYPGPAGEWVAAGSTVTPVNAFTDLGDDGVDPVFDANGADRGVYYYEVFAVDAAGNPSAVAAANDRATNYWLGDVTGVPSGFPNGLVQSYDITALGDAFGTVDGGPSGDYDNVIDVGPTYDWSRLGIPTTDSKINFEDLMVFSMNFGVVGESKTAPQISKKIDLAWVRYDDGRQALRLVSGSGVKGLNVRAKSRVSYVTAGDLLDQQSELTFLKNVGEYLDVSVAVTGTNVGFAGSGDLFVIDAADMIDVADLSIKVRGYDNSQLEFTMDEKSGSLAPRVFALNPNYPNPFNPMTKISFSLPEAQDVRLAVYGIDGRKVATLLNESRGPGLHEVIWNGQDDTGRQAASGMYFYRIEAGPYSQVHKMTLMK